MRHLGDSGEEKDIGQHHGTPHQSRAAAIASQESKIRPDHAPESPQQIGSMISSSFSCGLCLR
uniref:Uncharacterized protein n=1 Tax=Arundo donax TaxID=35708 RepID=A0A0A9G8M6_ARUDO